MKRIILAAAALAAAAPAQALTTISFTEVNHAGALTNQYSAFGINFALSGGLATARTYNDVRETFDMRGYAGTPERGNPNVIFDNPVDNLSFDYLSIGRSFFVRIHGIDDVALATELITVPTGVVTNASFSFAQDGIKRFQLLDIDQLIGVSTLRFDVPGAGGPGSGVDPIPEPATWAMMILGFGVVGSAVRGRRTRRHGLAVSV